MKKYELIAPCHFGLEAVLKREITELGYDCLQVEDGRLTFFGDEEAVSRANVFLRSAERILIKVGSFHAETFEELFQGTLALPWEEYIPRDGKFWVAKAASVKSRLFSPSDIQSIMKKAMVERLKKTYRTSWFEENGESFVLALPQEGEDQAAESSLDSAADAPEPPANNALTEEPPPADSAGERAPAGDDLDGVDDLDDGGEVTEGSPETEEPVDGADGSAADTPPLYILQAAP